MTDQELPKAIALLKKAVRAWKTPAVTVVARERDPYKVLVSCILSLRTQDAATAAASARLFALAGTPEAMLGIPEADIERAIYPVGFYRNKSKSILAISRIIVDNYAGKTPDDIDELLRLPGVGRKTANLVVTIGFGKPGICVDTHVHRITNRWGYVVTRTPEETEKALRARLPGRYWIPINDLLVTFGQNLCKPVSPICSTCPVFDFCDRVGVGKSR
ncbi:MAG: endonuclease III [Nitrospirae bacterium]|nr:endonuclease III [Nitrospirota bacterium]MBI5696494.1 endonuclease III [Nitrospirota bacterium]